ncbi:MAG: hypothetical protein CL470_06860 [Acidimicrobiaceae bacterium]|nr:hypothetical protein [Acidimicrobiaceae bacterium]|tara:strand:- start:57 stop:269 length:213 start_codon:yes stop_codon:yes gene_type:complete
MPSKNYDHYIHLSKEDLILIIEKKDGEIRNFLEKLKKVKELKQKYYEYNKFHMEEITRLDKQIGKLKGIR